MTRAAAPLLPMTAETIWRGLTGGASVHLEDWPSVAGWPSDDALADTMDLTRNVCSAALSLRKARQLRVRLPLASLTVAHAGGAARCSEFADIIKDEVNVKDLVLQRRPGDPRRVPADGQPARTRPAPRQAGAGGHQGGQGRRSGPRPGDVVTAAGVELQPGEYELQLTAADPDSTTALPGSNGLIALDATVTPELVAEGTARDVIRVIQQARKDAGLDVSDRITLVVGRGRPGGRRGPRARGVHRRGDAGHGADRRPRRGGHGGGRPQPVGDGGEVRVAVAKA